MDQSDSERRREEERSEMMPFLNWGWQFSVTLGVLAWGGHWLDQKLETKFLFVLLGVFTGLFGGFYNLFRIVSRLPKKSKK